MSRILATTLTYNPVDCAWLKAWVHSFRDVAPDVDLLIVDESPDPGVAACIRSLEKPGVKVERLEADDRVKAYNLGFTRAIEGDYEHVLFSDSDIIVLPGAVERMAACMTAYPRAGIVSALTNTRNTAGWKHMTIGIPDGLVEVLTGKHEADGVAYKGLRNWWRGEARHVKPMGPGFEFRDLAFRDDVFMVDAAFMLMRVSTIRELGGFDPALQHTSFAEDYAQRLVDKGWTWGVCKSAVVFHGQRGLGGNMDNGAHQRDTTHMHKKLGLEAIERLNEKVRACIYWSGWRDRDPRDCGPDDKEYWLHYNLKALRGQGPP